MSEYDEMPRGDGPEFYLAEIVAQTNKRSLALAIRRELGEGYVITPGIDMLYAVRRLARSRKSRALTYYNPRGRDIAKRLGRRK